MIEPLENLPAGVIGFRAVGRVEASDYRDVLVPALDAVLREHGRINVVLVIGGRAAAGVTAAAARRLLPSRQPA